MPRYCVGVNWDRVGSVFVEAADEEAAVEAAEAIARNATEAEQFAAFIEAGSEWKVSDWDLWEVPA